MPIYGFILFLLAALIVPTQQVCAHGAGVSGNHIVDWHSETVSRVIFPGWAWNNLGATSIALGTTSFSMAGSTVEIDGRVCLRAPSIVADMRDSYGFNLNEPVTLKLVVDNTSTRKVAVAYDAVGGAARVEHGVSSAGEGRLVELSINLAKARFANRGDHSTDVMLMSVAGPTSSSPPEKLTVCDIKFERSFTTPSEDFGWVDITLKDENQQLTGARVGLYDAEGRLPLPGNDAVSLRKFDDDTRSFLLQPNVVWPHSNRFVFYIDGRYRARLPVGQYHLIAAKGLEYRVLSETLTVLPEKTTTSSLELKRQFNLPQEGWYSGDVHIHSQRRESGDTDQLWRQVAAEDLHVGNILLMGNVAETYFQQYIWGREGRYIRDGHVLITGQEDPRTLTLGHTLHLNLEKPVRFPDEYLNYSRVFEAVADQGGISGFAHASGRLPGTTEGMAMQAAFGLLDFGEIMQAGFIGTEAWYTLLNLGYRVAPAAGSDYPYLDHVGAVRTYVNTGKPFDVDAWFDGLEASKTFVTNGPILDFTINGQSMGGELRVARNSRLQINARARLNPDIGSLTEMQLIKYGDTLARVASGRNSAEWELDEDLRALESAWYVIYARAKRPGHEGRIEAISAPIYVVVDGQERTWKRTAVPEIGEQLIAILERVKQQRPEEILAGEDWHTLPVWRRDFARQHKLAVPQITATQNHLRELVRQAIVEQSGQ